MSDEAKARVASMNRTYEDTVFSDCPAGSRMPKPFKKTYEDKLPLWIVKFR